MSKRCVFLVIDLYGPHFQLELSRTHTPRMPSICSLLHRDRPVMLTISTRSVVHMNRKLMLIVLVGMVDGRGPMANKQILFVTSMDRAKRFEAHSS